MAVINMSKNQKINMAKDDGSAIKKIFIGVAWDENRYAGESQIDIDLQGFITKSDRKVSYPEDVVNYLTYGDGKKYPWMEFSGDNLTGDDTKGIDFNGRHYDEYFIVNTEGFPSDRSELTICLSLFRAIQRQQNFCMVSNARMTICDYDDPSAFCAEYDLSEDDKFSSLNAVEMGRLYKYGNGFKFQALGSGYIRGMTELYKNFGLDIDEGRDE